MCEEDEKENGDEGVVFMEEDDFRPSSKSSEFEFGKTGDGSTRIGSETQSDPRDAYVTNVFRWAAGGTDVRLAGTFNGYKKTIPMHRSGHDFTCILDLPRGKHAFRFMVDSEWRYDSTGKKARDDDGLIHNWIDIETFKCHDEREKARKTAMKRSNTAYPNKTYGYVMPDVYELTGEPPQLPPHLRHIILNSQDADTERPTHLPEPQRVTLNHLYCTAVKHDLMVLGTTSRYKDKYVTSVLYSKANLRRS